MGRKLKYENQRPETATILNNFGAVREVVQAFANGSFSLVVLMGRPGLTKSRHVKSAISGTGAGYIKGYHTKLDYYSLLYRYQDKPIVVDDANRLWENKDTKEMNRDLTETDRYKRMEYGSTSKILEDKGLPNHFYTSSPVMFITNYWDSSDPVFKALESRAEFFVIEVGWEELHMDVARWFWDQEIFDYIQKRLHLLREPDARLYVKAYERKRSKLKLTPWQDLIDDYTDDDQGRVIRDTIDALPKSSDNQRYAKYLELAEKEGLKSLARSNFYERLKTIKAIRPTRALPYIKLKNTKPPEEQRPPDGLVPNKDDGENGDEEAE